jgi:plastocyanin
LRSYAAAAALAVVVLSLGFGKASAQTPTREQAGRTVSATDDVFSPATIRIDPGDTITWSNDGETVHTVTADDAAFDSGPMAAGDAFTSSFSEPGTYPYYCAVHGAAGGVGMSGTVVVRGEVSEPPAQPAGNEDVEVPAPVGTAAAPSEVLPATGAAPFGWLLLGFAHIGGGTLLLALARTKNA